MRMISPWYILVLCPLQSITHSPHSKNHGKWKYLLYKILSNVTKTHNTIAHILIPKVLKLCSIALLKTCKKVFHWPLFFWCHASRSPSRLLTPANWCPCSLDLEWLPTSMKEGPRRGQSPWRPLTTMMRVGHLPPLRKSRIICLVINRN